jgi:hypothetical protein
LRQAPSPSQTPSEAQLAGPASLHWSSGSWPSGTAAQVPAEPTRAQVRQLAVQRELQQTPCSQNPESQSAAAVHDAPSGFLPQLMFVQALGARQSALLVHDVRQSPSVPHMYGAHDCISPGTQVPAASQRDASVRAEPVHEAGRQMAPTA